ncbi:MAG TPA: YheU family protein [Steroidobacteraceae bacterium]|nr:YheU family protein [Steroidobacteraceae bacterium]
MTAHAIEIPCSELSAEALRGVVESFVLREGTDYGVRQHSFEEKVEQVLQQLRRGQAQILFDPDNQSVTIVPAPLSRDGGAAATGSRR